MKSSLARPTGGTLLIVSLSAALALAATKPPSVSPDQDAAENEAFRKAVTELVTKSLASARAAGSKAGQSCDKVSQALAGMPDFEKVFSSLELGRGHLAVQELQSAVQGIAGDLVRLSKKVPGKSAAKPAAFPDKKLLEDNLKNFQRQLVEYKAKLGPTGLGQSREGFMAGMSTLESFLSQLYAALQANPSCFQATAGSGVGAGGAAGSGSDGGASGGGAAAGAGSSSDIAQLIGVALLGTGNYLLNLPSNPRVEKAGTHAVQHGFTYAGFEGVKQYEGAVAVEKVQGLTETVDKQFAPPSAPDTAGEGQAPPAAADNPMGAKPDVQAPVSPQTPADSGNPSGGSNKTGGGAR